MFHMYYFCFALATYEAHGSIWAIRRTCGVSVNPILRYFDNLERLNTRYLPSQRGSLVHELINGLGFGTMVPSEDLNGVGFTMRR
jgi:hypothetical protein